MKIASLILILFLTQIFNAQDSKEISAKHIVEQSLTYAGGISELSKISTLELIYLHLDPDGKSASIIEKRKGNSHLTQSIISQNNDSQTTFYDGKNIVWVRGKSVKKFADSSLPEMKLKAFSNILLGYENLGYRYTRLKDEKFDNFDCYVVEAKSKDGYATTNFFDKTNFRHMMIVYPNGNKSLIIEDAGYGAVRFSKHMLNTDSAGKVSQLILVDAQLNSGVSDLWFSSPYQQDYKLPDHIKFGTFEAVGSGTIINRNSNSQSETSGASTLALKVDWIGEDMFELRSNEQVKGEGTFVRIVSWNESQYICHIMGLASAGTGEFKKL